MERGCSATAPRCTPAPVLVVGFGNVLRGDDGIGVRVIQALQAVRLPPGVEAAEGGTRGLDLLTLMEGRQKVIVVDAALVGKGPGEFQRVEVRRADLNEITPVPISHSAGVCEALQIAQALDVLPESVVIFGVQPACLEWSSTLSPQVEANLPTLLAAVLAEIEIGRLSAEG